MKKVSKKKTPDDLLPEYDFRGGVRGKYAGSYAKGTNLVLLSPDTAEIFPDSESVNRALRACAEIARVISYDGEDREHKGPVPMRCDARASERRPRPPFGRSRSAWYTMKF